MRDKPPKDEYGPLSGREQEVAYLVAQGFTNREVAQQLQIGQNTVKNYLFRIFEKLEISSRIELVLYVSKTTGLVNAHGNQAHNSLTESALQESALQEPPSFPKFLLLLIPKNNREHLLGDLDEEYRTILLPEFGSKKALLWYPRQWSVLSSRVCVVRSGIAVVGFVARHRVPERAPSPFPSALAQERIEQLGCFLRWKEMLVVVDFHSGNRDQVDWHPFEILPCFLLLILLCFQTADHSRKAFLLHDRRNLSVGRKMQEDS